MPKVINLSVWLLQHNAYKEFERAIKKGNRKIELLDALNYNPYNAIDVIHWSSNQYPHIAWDRLHMEWNQLCSSLPESTKYVYIHTLLKKA